MKFHSLNMTRQTTCVQIYLYTYIEIDDSTFMTMPTRECDECEGDCQVSYINGETRRYGKCESCDGTGKVDVLIGDYISKYDRTKGDAVPDDIWEHILDYARGICADYEIDPSKIVFVRGPDEWGVGTVENYTSITVCFGFAKSAIIDVLELIGDQTSRDEVAELLVTK